MKLKMNNPRGRFVIQDINNQYLYTVRECSAYTFYETLHNHYTDELEEAELFDHDAAQKKAKSFPKNTVKVIRVVRSVAL